MADSLTRRSDWEPRLNALIADRRTWVHEYGNHDCALWPAAAVEAITGEDFGAPFRGKYSDETGARAALREFGAGTLVKTFDSHLKRIDKAMAQRGDLALHEGHVGVVLVGEALFVGQEGGREGFVRIPRADWTLCWRVGR